METYSDYIVFVDESGDHGLENVNPEYPIFALSFFIIQKDIYIDSLTVKVRRLKMETFGHDLVVLHEYDMRKKRGAFSKLGESARETFLNSLTEIIKEMEFTLIAVVIDKRRLKAKYVQPGHPYHLAMEFGLERLQNFLRSKNQLGRRTQLICEARGAKEDEY